MKAFSIGQWKFPAGMVETPVARKLIALCYINNYSTWTATNSKESFIVMTELYNAEKECDEFLFFPRHLHVVLVRKDELQQCELTPAEQGQQDGIVAAKEIPPEAFSSQFP